MLASTNRSEGMSVSGFDPQECIAANQSAFRVDQIAKLFHLSTQHIFSLIKEGEIVVPQERIDRSLSRACILVPRDNLVDFLRRRSSAEWFKKCEKRNKKVAPECRKHSSANDQESTIKNAKPTPSQPRQ
jgi:hypothetical protein